MSALYNSPVLYDRSKSIVEHFAARPRTRNHILFADHSGLPKTVSFVDMLEAARVPYEMYYLAEHKNPAEESDILASLPAETIVLHDFTEAGLTRILREQKMGTHLYLSGQWKTMETMYTLAVTAGFGEEEIQVIPADRMERSVFCPKCYSLTAVQDEQVTRCSYCGVMLNISTHYSRVRRGYLGYPFV
jgi:hypothetical protein